MSLHNKFFRKVEFITHVLIRNASWNFVRYRGTNHLQDKPLIIGMIHERNEALLLKDTLDHISQFVDGVVVFDDDSEDESVKIALEHPIVLEVIKNNRWRKKHRKWEETSNRRKLLEIAKRYQPEWLFYFDADERFEGDIRDYVKNVDKSVDGVRISLLDAYITKEDRADYTRNDVLLNFRHKFGIERRDILMLWRCSSGASYIYPDSREPARINPNKVRVKFWCQHYGKAVSIQQWEDTCKYYANNFPMYAEKWRARMGRAIHDKSDFDTELYTWEEAKVHSIPLN